MATAATFPIEETFSSFTALENPPVNVGDRVVWLGNDDPEHGTVRWLGVLTDICNGWTAGIELDNPVGGIDGHWGGQRLFTCKEKHGIIIGLSGLIKEEDFFGDGPNDTASAPSDLKSMLLVDEKIVVKSGRPNTSNKADGGGKLTVKTEAIKETVELKNEGDKNIEKFLATNFSPRCAGSFDRRVYARMFAECEVEKWYEVLNYSQEGDGTSSTLDHTLSKEQKQEHDLFFNKLKELPLERNVHRQETKKKERGGIFRFFRWLRRNKKSSSGTSHGPGARRTLSAIRVSDIGRGKAKSLDSVTSLSQSFHYIPVGVVSSDRDVNRCETPPSKDCVYEDVDLHCTPHASPAKLPKYHSLSRCNIPAETGSKKDVYRGKLKSNSVRGAFSSNSISSSLVRKKRRAPLPPLTNSAPATRSNWVKDVPVKSERNQLLRPSSSAFSSPQVSSGRLQRNPTASSTGAICNRVPNEEGSSSVSCSSNLSSKSKHKRSASLTAAPNISATPSFTPNINVSHHRVGSHVKNKRKAPAPPSPVVSRNEPLSTNSSCHEHSDAAGINEIEKQEKRQQNSISLLNRSSNNLQSSGVATAMEKDEADVPPILPAKTKCKILPKETALEKRMDIKTCTANGTTVQNSNITKSSDPLEDPERRLLKEDKGFIGIGGASKEEESKAVNLEPEKKTVRECELPQKPIRRTSKTSSASSNSSPSIHMLKNLHINENTAGNFSQQESQMNIEALQDLVESLVVLYCGGNSKKDDDPNYSNMKCSSADVQLLESYRENEREHNCINTEYKIPDDTCQAVVLKRELSLVEPIARSLEISRPVEASEASDTTTNSLNDNPEHYGDDGVEDAEDQTTSISNDPEEDYNDDDVVNSDFANELLERWQTRMQEQFLNVDLNIYSKHKMPLEGKSRNDKEEDSGDDAGSGIYEPIGNFFYYPNIKCESKINTRNVALCSQGKGTGSDKDCRAGQSCRSEAGNVDPSPVQDNHRSATEVRDGEQDDLPKDPFIFWRDLCARETLEERRTLRDMSKRRCSDDLIRRLSVNGRWQAMKGNNEDDHGTEIEDRQAKKADKLSGPETKSANVSRARSLHSDKERDFHYYENTFTATPHRVVVVDGISMPSPFTACAPAVPAYWPPPAPMMAYGHSLQRQQQQQHHHQPPFAHFPALAIVPLPSSAIPQQVFTARPFPSGGFVPPPPYANYLYSRVPTVDNTSTQANPNQEAVGSYVNRQTERMDKNSQLSKHSLTQNPNFQEVSQNRVGEYHMQKSFETRQQSPLLNSDQDTREKDDDEEIESSDSGKRTYANVWHRCRKGQDGTYANVPPPSPLLSQQRGSRRGCPSSRLSANCNWLKESSKTVEAKIKAAQDSSCRVVDCNSGRRHSRHSREDSPIATVCGVVTSDDGGAVALTCKPPPHPTKAQQDSISSNHEKQVGGPSKIIPPPSDPSGKLRDGSQHEHTAVGHLPESVAKETFHSLMDCSIVIGGVNVVTPFRLWPLEYQLIAPELEKLKSRLDGSALPVGGSSSESSVNSDVDGLAVTKLMKKLEVAICRGKADEAANLARDLAFLKIQCLVVPNRKPKEEEQQPAPIVVHLFVEDRVSHHGPIPIRVVPSITVGELKMQIFVEFQFPIALQRWIIGRKLENDDGVKLSTLGVDADGCPLFLYLLSVADLGVKHKDLVWENDGDRSTDKIGKKRVPNRPRRARKSAAGKEFIKKLLLENSSGLNDRSVVQDPLFEDDVKPVEATALLGWQCESCTLINKPTRPGCDMCGSARPPTYVIPVNYKMSESELKRIEQEEAQEKALKEDQDRQRIQNWQRYLDLDDQAIIFNSEAFECNVCFIEIQPGEGVQLRDCLHCFCCDCLRKSIEHCEDTEVKCPYRDDRYSCESVLQEREIRALVPGDVLDKFLQRSMARAESQAKNSFHCKTPDCKGWCLFEDNANEFFCPVCDHKSCITCRAIHENVNCQQYQNQLMQLARTNEEARKTADAIEVMLQQGEALRCPNCQVIIMKKWGCDWLSCSYCKTEICWVTKGPRWGPRGRGDVSAGCRCGVNGKKCHPNCSYCH